MGEVAREDARDEATIALARESAVSWGTKRGVVIIEEKEREEA